MAIGVVDVFEFVEIEHHEGQRLAALSGLLNQGVGGGVDAAPVEAASQWVMLSQSAGFLL